MFPLSVGCEGSSECGMSRWGTNANLKTSKLKLKDSYSLTSKTKKLWLQPRATETFSPGYIKKCLLDLTSVCCLSFKPPKTADTTSFTILWRRKTFLRLSVKINTTRLLVEATSGFRRTLMCFQCFPPSAVKTADRCSNITHSFLHDSDSNLQLSVLPSSAPRYGSLRLWDEGGVEAVGFSFKKFKLHHSTQFSQVMRIYRN